MSRVSRREREIEIAGLTRGGLSRDQIADRLGLSAGYVGEVCNRLGLDGPRPLPVAGGTVRSDGVHHGVPDDEYHADVTALSSSGARLLLPPSAPELFRHAMDAVRKPKREFDFGHIAHRLLLGDGARFEVLAGSAPEPSPPADVQMASRKQLAQLKQIREAEKYDSDTEWFGFLTDLLATPIGRVADITAEQAERILATFADDNASASTESGQEN